MVRLLKDCCPEWLNNTCGVTLSNIEVGKGSIVATSNNDITVLVIEGKTAKW